MTRRNDLQGHLSQWKSILCERHSFVKDWYFESFAGRKQIGINAQLTPCWLCTIAAQAWIWSELKCQYISAIFDGTTWYVEALAIVVCFVQDCKIEQHLVWLLLLAKLLVMNLHKNCWLFFSTELSVTNKNLLPLWGTELQWMVRQCVLLESYMDINLGMMK